MRAHRSSGGAAHPDAYEGYENWKAWHRPFTFTTDDAEYYTGETRGLRIDGADVLEIGFGSGSFLAWAQSIAARPAGTEINPALIDAAKQFGIELLPAAFEAVATSHADRFDTIVAFDVFEHFTRAEIVTRLAAIATMLKPGGHLVLRFPNAQSPFGLAPQYGDPTHQTPLSRSVLERLAYGLPLEVIRYAPSFRVRGRDWRKRLGRAARYAARDTISLLLNAVYCQDIPWDGVVVLVLRKPGDSTRRA